MKKVEQLSIRLSNKPDIIASITDLLAQHCINIRALSFTDTTDTGLLRLIVNDTAKAAELIKQHGLRVESCQVLAIEVPDKPGGLASVLDTVRNLDLQVEYIYAFSQKSGKSGLIIFRFDDLEIASARLVKAKMRLLSNEELDAM